MDLLGRVMAGVVGATHLGCCSQHCAHDLAFVLPHLLQLLEVVIQEGLVYIFGQLVDVKALGSTHCRSAPLAHSHAKRTEESQVANVEVWRLCWLPHELDEWLSTLALEAGRDQQLLCAAMARRAIVLHRDLLLAGILLADLREDQSRHHLDILLAVHRRILDATHQA